MNQKIVRANLLLLLVALIWGSTFAAQRLGMRYVGPFTFNFVRFLLGAAVLFPLALKTWRDAPPPVAATAAVRWLPLWGSALAGLALFTGINLQQIGLITTSAANAGFITGLYVIIVPMTGLLFGMRCGPGVWTGAILGVVGLYLLSIADTLALSSGDAWILAGAFAWAGHVLIIGWLSPKIHSFYLAFGQALVCGILSFFAALAMEDIQLGGILDAAMPLLFSGVVTTGIAFTLQVVAQKDSPPAHAALIMQMETVFAALAGWLFLGETMTGKGIAGAALIMTGMLIAQFWRRDDIA
jgi:drug/metabolite transporter (DMT)-like permease